VYDIWIPVFIFLFGLAIGSFLNVCIYRIPREGLSVHVPPRSFCPTCYDPIRISDNIPVLSYLLLKGKCRHCRSQISVLYPLVELATAVIFLLLSYQLGLTSKFLLAIAFIAVLLPISIIDAQHYIIPNTLIVTGLILGFSIVCVITITDPKEDIGYLLERLIGAVASGVAFWLIAVIGSALLRKKAMGGGDIKLMVLNGLFLGAWHKLVIVVALSALSGAILGTLLIILGIKNRQSPIPYGPFLAGAAVIAFLWGDDLWQVYLTFVGWS